MESLKALERLHSDIISLNEIEEDEENIKNDYNIIRRDLERLKKMNEIWHKHEPMESVDINGKHLEELYSFISRLIQENEKLKQALDKACEKFDYTCPVEEELIEDLDCENCNDNYKECWKKYFLKEVLGNENSNL